MTLEEKKFWLKKRFCKNKIDFTDDRDVIVIKRQNILQESFEAFKTMKLDYRKELQIYFVDEPAQDAGGIAREWFCNLIPHLFDKELGVFKKVDNELYFFNPVDEEDLEEETLPLKYANFAGKIIAKALFDDVSV